MYRLARNHTGLVKTHDWRWYLEHAYQTTVAMMRDAPHYAQFGQMEGDVFVDILKDLKREGMAPEAAEMERLMKGRADHWKTLPYPFGSEMAWDSTGQPEVYAWMRYFGHQPQADETREVILAYDPAVRTGDITAMRAATGTSSTAARSRGSSGRSTIMARPSTRCRCSTPSARTPRTPTCCASPMAG